jgi:hypothetical protein
MLHLPTERLAELVDEGATAPEREHLAVCSTCTVELQAYRRLVAMAADERRRIAPPHTEWNALRQALRAEGLIAPADGERAGSTRFAPLFLLRRVAAILVLVGGGAILGRMSAGLGVVDALAIRSGATPAQSVADGGSNGVQLASNNDGGFVSTQDAVAALERAQRAYEEAAAYIATHDTSSMEQAPEQYRTRLAALDRTAETMYEALHEAPQDPLINQYLVATLGAREQTLRRLGTALPVGNRLVRQ